MTGPATANHTHRPRITSLDPLRGFAAVAVVFAHAFDSIVVDKDIWSSPLYFLKAGHEAVIFFFVLSGYVLVYQYKEYPGLNYFRFLMQRYFRIYIPYIVSILFALLLRSLCSPTPAGTLWVSAMWRLPVTPGVLIKHLILVCSFPTGTLNPVIWSLVHEMRFAIVFPFVLYLLRFKLGKTLIITGAIALLALVLNKYRIGDSIGFYNSYTYSIYYVCIFIFGGLLAKYKAEIGRVFSRLNKWQTVAVLFAALVIYNYSNLIFRLTGIAARPRMQPLILEAISDLLSMLASGCFIILATNVTSPSNILNKKFPLLLGKISYSLYLVHTPILAFCYFTLNSKIPVLAIMTIGVATSFVMALLFNRFVEQNAVRFFKKLLPSASSKA